jgi:hypothetical protein
MVHVASGPSGRKAAAARLRAVSGSAVGYAVAAAVCIALGSALQHQVAGGHDHRGGIGLLWRLARSRRWMTGLAAAGAGTLLHAAALRGGALAVVEPVLVMNVALALPARALLDRARPSAAQALAAAVLGAGVAVFVIAARPSTGQAAPGARGAAVVIAAGVALAVLCPAAAARAQSGRVAGSALGLAAGTLYGLAGGVLKAAVNAVLHDPAAALAGWPAWALAVLGGWAFLLHQRAYTRAPLGVSLPVLSVANPLAGMAFGALAFGEIPASGPLAVSGEVLGLAVIVTSVMMLTRHGADPGRHRRSTAGLAVTGVLPAAARGRLPVRAIVRRPQARLAGLLAAAGLAAVACGALLQDTAAGEETVRLNPRVAELVARHVPPDAAYNAAGLANLVRPPGLWFMAAMAVLFLNVERRGRSTLRIAAAAGGSLAVAAVIDAALPGWDRHQAVSPGAAAVAALAVVTVMFARRWLPLRGAAVAAAAAGAATAGLIVALAVAGQPFTAVAAGACLGAAVAAAIEAVARVSWGRWLADSYRAPARPARKVRIR